MATIDKHELLFSTDLKFFKALQIIGGKSIFDRYRNVKSTIIGNYIDEGYQGFLAYPVSVEGDKIEFHGVRAKKTTPKVLSELNEEEAEKYQAIKEETLKHYNDKINHLQAIGKVPEATFLVAAIKSVDDRFIFCYDDKVVLGAWGMKIRDNVRENITEIRKQLPKKKPLVEPKVEPAEEPVEAPPVPNLFTVSFSAGEAGYISEQQTMYSKNGGDFVTEGEIPKVVANEGYEFLGWDENPKGYNIMGDKVFTAQYRKIPPVILPWWKRFWLWLTALFAGGGCLKWLLRVLLFLLLLLLLLWLFKKCRGEYVGGGTALGNNDSAWLSDDPNRGHDGGIYDPYNPYDPQPTPPSHGDVLPPQQGVLPPIGDNPDIVPGNPSIIANRLNILMDNQDKSIMDLARAFKEKYSDEKYKVIYYDDVVKRMQVEIPKEDRERMKQEIPTVFAPEYELFVFDETLFEGAYKPKDPAFSDPEKSWYLKAVHAPEAWDITRGSEHITVAIVDNGFNLKHPELSSKVVQAYNVWKHSDEIYPQQVDHGTHVAGTALAIADNNQGICGIAPNCKFMPVQVANEQGQMTITSVLDGVLYALYQGADVINVSLGGMFAGLDQYAEEVQKDLINNHFKEEERLWRHIMRIAAQHNASIVIAAGNDNVLAGIDAIQRPELFITVSAVDKNNRSNNKAAFSNYGQYADISAPGVGIYSSVGAQDYQMMDGTSMAAPIVTGAVALMRSLNDSITNKQILCILQNTALPTEDNIGKLLQIDKALKKVKTKEVVDCTPEPSTGEVQVLLSWNNYNDLDLSVFAPNNETVWYKNPRVASGGQLEIDMNRECPDSKTPIENIYWEEGRAPDGTYNVYIKYFKKHRGIANNPYKVVVKYEDKTEEYTGIISDVGEVIHICSFTLGDADNDHNATSPNAPPSADNRKLQLEQERHRLQKELDRINRELRRIGN